MATLEELKQMAQAGQQSRERQTEVEETDDEQLQKLRGLARDNNVLEDVYTTVRDGGINVIKGLGRVLNVGAAASAGAVTGVIDDEKSVVDGIKDGVKSDMTYSDVIRNNHELFGLPDNPEDYSRTQKAVVGGAGLAGDILLDPLTYATFGVGGGFKIAGKGASATARNLVQKGIQNKASRESMQELLEISVKRNGEIPDAVRSRLKAQNVTDDIIDEAAQNAARLTEEPAMRFSTLGGNTSVKVPGTAAVGKKIKDVNEKVIKKLPGMQKLQGTLGKMLVTDPVANNLVRRTVREVGHFTGKKMDEIGGVIDNAFGKGNPYGKLTEADQKVFSDTILEMNQGVRKADEVALKEFREEYGYSPSREALRDLDVESMDTPYIPESVRKDVGALTIEEKEEMLKLAQRNNIPINKAYQEIQDDLSKHYSKHASNVLADQKRLLGKAKSARKTAKARMRTKKADDLFTHIDDAARRQRLTHAAKLLFEKTPDGKPGLVPRLSAMAGIPKEEGMKFYFPYNYRDKINKKGTRAQALMKLNDDFKKFSYGVVNDQLIRNPAEAYAIGSLDVARAAIKTDSVKTLLGKEGRGLSEFASKEAAEAAGFKKFSYKGIDGKKMEGYLPEDMADEIQPWLKGKQDPVDDFFQATGFDAMTRLFKSWVTGPFPAFHIRNLIGNEFLQFNEAGFSILSPRNQMQAMKIMTATRKLPKEAPEAAKRALKRKREKLLQGSIKTGLGEEIPMKDIVEAMEKRGILGHGAVGVGLDDMLNIGKYRKGTIPENLRFAHRFNPFSRDFALTRIGRDMGSAIEDQGKANIFLNQVKKGKSFDEAWEVTEKALFDYANLTDFERKYLRRVIPFYAFTRKNLEAQVRTLLKRPGRQAAKMKIIESASEALGEPIQETDYEGLPPWVQNSLGIKIDQTDEFGRPLFITGLGLPIEHAANYFSGEKDPLTNTVASTLSQMNPILKVPMERATGVDFFRQENLERIDNAEDFSMFINALPEGASKDIKSVLDWNEKVEPKYDPDGNKIGEETTYTADPMKLHFLRNMFLSRVFSTANDAFSEQGTMPRPWKEIKLLSGIRASAIDKQRQQYFDELEEKEELMRVLDRMGVIKQYESYFDISDED